MKYAAALLAALLATPAAAEVVSATPQGFEVKAEATVAASARGGIRITPTPARRRV